MSDRSQKIKINETVVNTFSYLKGNFSEDEFFSSSDKNLKLDVQNDEGIHLDSVRTLSNDDIKNICKKINSDVNEVIVKDLFDCEVLNIKFEGEKTLNIKSDLKENSSSKIFNISCDKEDSHLYFYSEILGKGYQFNYLYNINIKSNSKITLIVFTNSEAKGFINVLGNCENAGNIEILFINVNKNSVYTNCNVYLNGEHSSSNIDVCYICSGDYKFDYNLTSSMVGKKTNSTINGKGVLLENAKKIFRGTIDFRKGCVGSEGCENEEVIILSKKVKNQSLPLLLCKEKNVKGSHGFTANSMDLDKVFYLLSRGFSEKEAKGLILRGKFLNMLKEVKNQEIVDKFIELLMEAI